MAFFRGPNIVTRDLIVSLDAASTRSYPGSGGVWYDLSGNGVNLGSSGSPTLTTLGGATCFNFDQDGDKWSGPSGGIPSTVNSNTTQRTLEAWLYPASSEVTSGDRGTIILLNGGSGNYMSITKSSRQLSSYWYGKNSNGYHQGAPAITNLTWNHWCTVWTGSELKQWQNGTKYTTSNITGTSTRNTNLIIGRESSGRQYAGGIAIVRIYNGALSDDEVSQNYNAQKTRFGR
tara:strand:+ start:15 stop:710 length:696 start_codon:yes stop_codon:yes gene_type:complete